MAGIVGGTSSRIVIQTVSSVAVTYTDCKLVGAELEQTCTNVGRGLIIIIMDVN